MRVKFWGVRGSLPSPVSTKRITRKIISALSGAEGVDLGDPKAVEAYVESLPLHIRGTAGGNTSCVEVRVAGMRIIFDAGSGLRELGTELMKEEFGQGRGTAYFFISHTHWDHIQGFPYFIPAYIPGNRFYIYSPKRNIEEKFIRQQVDQDMFPVGLREMGAECRFHLMGPEGVNLGGVQIDSVVLAHPGGSWAYRLRTGGKTLVYATDGEYKDLSAKAIQAYLDFFADADVMIFDSMYTFSESVAKEGWGHSTSLIGVDLAVKTGVKKLILFHHEPTYHDVKLNDILDKTKQYYNLVREHGQLEISLAVEGEELEI